MRCTTNWIGRWGASRIAGQPRRGVRTRSILAISALLVPVVGCLAPDPGLDPEATLSRYLEATKAGRWAVAYGDLSASDRAYRSFDEYRSTHADDPMAALLSKAEFEIKEATLEDDRATVVVAVTGVDEDRLADTLGDIPLDEAREVAELAKGDLPTTTRDETFVLLREKGLWKVFLGLEADALIDEGRELQEAGDDAAARTRFEAALVSNPGSLEAAARLQDVEKALAERRERDDYMSSIEIRDVRIQRGEGPEGEAVSLRAEVRNTGERTLSWLDIHAACFDDGGNEVSEAEYRVFGPGSVPPDGSDPLDSAKGLKPHSARQVLIKLENVPSGWSGDVKVRVGGFALVEGSEGPDISP